MLEIQQKNMKFKSKAHTLSSLKLKNSIIPELHIYNCNNYQKNKNKVLNTIASKFLDSRVAIRSSFENEDTDKSSNAGKYNLARIIYFITKMILQVESKFFTKRSNLFHRVRIDLFE